MHPCVLATIDCRCKSRKRKDDRFTSQVGQALILREAFTLSNRRSKGRLQPESHLNRGSYYGSLQTGFWSGRRFWRDWAIHRQCADRRWVSLDSHN